MFTLEAETLTVQQVADEAAIIARGGPDDEMLHAAEDTLYTTVLQAIASGRLQGEDARLAAQHAITTLAGDFCRWTA